jgi:hypothetical protein
MTDMDDGNACVLDVVHTSNPDADGDGPEPIDGAWHIESRTLLIPASGIHRWWEQRRGINLHRSLAVAVRSEPVFGPLLIDIDTDPLDWGGDGLRRSFEKRIQESTVAVRAVVECLLGPGRFDPGDMRVRFSGSKGYHVEVRPGASTSLPSNPHAFRDAVVHGVRGEENAKHISGNTVPGTKAFIDPPHKHIRLANSINAWVEDGQLHLARNIPIGEDELSSVRPAEIMERSGYRREPLS